MISHSDDSILDGFEPVNTRASRFTSLSSIFSDSPLVVRQIGEIYSHFDFVGSTVNRFSSGEMLQWKPGFYTSHDFAARGPTTEMGPNGGISERRACVRAPSPEPQDSRATTLLRYV